MISVSSTSVCSLSRRQESSKTFDCIMQRRHFGLSQTVEQIRRVGDLPCCSCILLSDSPIVTENQRLMLHPVVARIVLHSRRRRR